LRYLYLQNAEHLKETAEIAGLNLIYPNVFNTVVLEITVLVLEDQIVKKKKHNAKTVIKLGKNANAQQA